MSLEAGWGWEGGAGSAWTAPPEARDAHEHRGEGEHLRASEGGRCLGHPGCTLGGDLAAGALRPLLRRVWLHPCTQAGGSRMTGGPRSAPPPCAQDGGSLVFPSIVWEALCRCVWSGMGVNSPRLACFPQAVKEQDCGSSLGEGGGWALGQMGRPDSQARVLEMSGLYLPAVFGPERSQGSKPQGKEAGALPAHPVGAGAVRACNNRGSRQRRACRRPRRSEGGPALNVLREAQAPKEVSECSVE